MGWCLRLARRLGRSRCMWVCMCVLMCVCNATHCGTLQYTAYEIVTSHTWLCMKSSRRTHDDFISWCVCDGVFMTICNDCACEMVYVWRDGCVGVKWYIFDLMWWMWNGAWLCVRGSSSSSSCLLSTTQKNSGKTKPIKCESLYVDFVSNPQKFLHLYMNICL